MENIKQNYIIPLMMFVVMIAVSMVLVPAFALAQGSSADLDEAEEAALDHVGEGEVTDSEYNEDDEEYEVEITLDDDSTVVVVLDEDFDVISSTENDDDDDEDNDDKKTDKTSTTTTTTRDNPATIRALQVQLIQVLQQLVLLLQAQQR